jgi:putative transposase
MKGKKFIVEQITGALREYDAGLAAVELCRRLGIAANTLYRWKAKYGGLEASEAKRLRELRGRDCW